MNPRASPHLALVQLVQLVQVAPPQQRERRIEVFDLDQPARNGHLVDDIKRAVLPNLGTSRVDDSTLDDDAAVAEALRWIAKRYLMSDAFARILLSQLARQDGVSEVAAARSVLVTAFVEAAIPTSLP